SLLFYSSLGKGMPATKSVSYSEFLAALQDDQVETVRVTHSELVGIKKSGNKTAEPASITTPRLPAMDESWVMQELRQRHIQIIAEPQKTSGWTGLLAWLFPILMIV